MGKEEFKNYPQAGKHLKEVFRLDAPDNIQLCNLVTTSQKKFSSKLKILTIADYDLIMELLVGKDGLVIGPGMGTDGGT